MFDPKYETYVVHIEPVSFVALPSFSPLKADIHPFHKSQISNLIAKKSSTKILAKYLDFVDIFSLDLVFKLSKYTEINKHAIKLVDGQQPIYKLIYSLRPVELETLKAYIKTHLANNFIRPSKSPSGAPILFDQKSDGFLRLCINY